MGEERHSISAAARTEVPSPAVAVVVASQVVADSPGIVGVEAAGIAEIEVVVAVADTEAADIAADMVVAEPAAGKARTNRFHSYHKNVHQSVMAHHIEDTVQSAAYN